MPSRRVHRPHRAPHRHHGRPSMPALFAFLLLAASSAPLRAQTIDDGVMMPRKSLCTGFLYTHGSWDRYWEGTLKRGNGNIGTITTESLAWMGNYGVTDRLNLIAEMPYVWTGASQGVLHGMSGFQDLTAAAKYSFLETGFTGHGSLRAIAVASAAIPLGDYTPDFQPLSIGSASKRFSGRLTVDFEARKGWFLNGTAAYTWRDNVTLDRPSYYTDGHLHLSNEVAMPDVFDYTVSAGYRKQGLYIPVSFSQQTTLGGGDVRRQDMPFVSNRMNSSRLDALVMYTLPKTRALAVKVAGTYTVSGRNVGQAAAVTAGLLYTFHF